MIDVILNCGNIKSYAVSDDGVYIVTEFLSSINFNLIRKIESIYNTTIHVVPVKVPCMFDIITEYHH